MVNKEEVKFLIYRVSMIVAMKKNGFNTIKTAEAMDTSQPNVSKVINKFEEYMGCGIFTRDNRGQYTGFTKEGEKVLRRKQGQSLREWRTELLEKWCETGSMGLKGGLAQVALAPQIVQVLLQYSLLGPTR